MTTARRSQRVEGKLSAPTGHLPTSLSKMQERFRTLAVRNEAAVPIRRAGELASDRVTWLWSSRRQSVSLNVADRQPDGEACPAPERIVYFDPAAMGRDQLVADKEAEPKAG